MACSCWAVASADLFGRRQLFVGGLIGFAIVSAAGGLAADFSLLVIAHAVQGIAAAAVAPAALSMLTTSFHGPARTRVLGYYGATASVGFVLGLVLGGVLVQTGGWRAVFFVNVPICLLCVVLGRRVLPVGTVAVPRPHLDVIGAFLVTAGMAGARLCTYRRRRQRVDFRPFLCRPRLQRRAPAGLPAARAP